LPEWATFVSGRYPEWKLHTGRGKAKNAVSYGWSGRKTRPSELWEMVNGEWVKRLDTHDYDHDTERVKQAMKDIK
jgi:hypothetical protein